MNTAPSPDPTALLTADDVDRLHAAALSILDDIAAGRLVPIECATEGCTDAAYLHPISLRDEDFDPACVVCRECLEASIPEDVRHMVPASAPKTTERNAA